MQPAYVRSDAGCGGLERLCLGHASGATAEVYRYGGHVASWRPPGRSDVFFMGRQAVFNGVKPIRGGIPVIFPQFGDGPFPKHGFARTQAWAVADSGVLPDGRVFAALALEDTAATRAVWPFRFRLELRLELDERLAVTATVCNRDGVDFAFQFALHTYFAVADIRRTRIPGFKGARYLDSVLGNAERVEDREVIGFSEETDRVYVGVGDALELHDDALPGTVRLVKAGMPDVVVWNPWIERSRTFADLGGDEYERMVCVETGCIAAPVRLRPGQSWQGGTRFAVTNR